MTETERKSPFAARLILFAFCFSGAAALIYEVAWMRSLSQVLGNTTYAVSTMLSAFMAGLALGGYAGGRLGSRAGNTILIFGLCEVGIGAFGLLTIPAINSLSPVYFIIYNRYHLVPDVFFVLQFAACFAIMLVPTTLMGATFPIVTKIVSGNFENLAVDVGRVYSINTLGAIAGAFSAGFILIPVMGVKSAVQIASIGNLGVALAALLASGSKKAVFLGGSGMLVIALLNVMAAKSEPRPYEYNFYIADRHENLVEFTAKANDYKLLFKKDDPHGTVKVFMNMATNSLVLQNGGKMESSTGGDMEAMIMLALLPLAANPEAKNFLGIGLGSGMTLRTAKDKLDDVDWVEINPAVVQAAGQFFFPELFKSGVNIIVDDARHYLQTTDRKYDIITSQPSYPTEPAPANLFTKEFFETLEKRLNVNGVVCQWFPYYLYSDESILIMLKTFMSVFPNVNIWKVTLTGDLLFIGTKKPFDRFENSTIFNRVTGLNNYNILLRYNVFRDMGQIKAVMLKDMKKLPYNTDDKPILEFTAAGNFLTGVKRTPAR